MKPIKLSNNENVNPLQTRTKIKRISLQHEFINNLAQLNLSPLRQKVENDAQQNLEAISQYQTMEFEGFLKPPSTKERAQSVLEDSDFGAWKDSRYLQPTSNQHRIKLYKRSKNTCQFKIRQPSPKIQQQKKTINKIIEYPLAGYLESNLEKFFQKDKYFKIIQNITGATHRNKTKKSNCSTSTNSRAQSSLSFQI